MTITKTKDFAKIFAIISGFFFLICGALKTVYAAAPLFIYMFECLINNSNIYFSIDFDQVMMLEIVALFTLSALCYSCKRSNALIIPVVSLAFVNLYSLVISAGYDVYVVFNLLMGRNMSDATYYSNNLFYVLFSIISLIALFFLFLLISVNVSMKKGIVLQIVFAILAVVTSIIAYVSLCVGDVIQIISGLLFEGGYGFLHFIGWSLLMPAVNNLVQLGFVVGVLLMAIWLVFRPKTVEVQVKEKKSKKKNAEEVTEDGFIETTADDNAEAAPTEGEAFTEKAFAET